MTKIRGYTLLLILALVPAYLPASFPSTCDMTPHPDLAACTDCGPSGCRADDCAADDHRHASDACCGDGCEHCNLPCCTGKVMVAAATPRPDALPAITGFSCGDAPGAPQVDGDPLYHPPRV